MAKPIRVLVIDDSAVVRKIMSEILSSASGIEVIATASDPLFALEKMKTEWPDVITLDVEMPRMDGISFLKKIMAERPTPVIICSSLTRANSETALQASAAGAVEIITKPEIGLKDFLHEAGDEVITAVRAAAAVNVRALKAPPAPVLVNKTPCAMVETTDRFIAIGTSTGGTQALERVLPTLPRTCPGIVVVQHMPEKFTGLFAQRLNSICEVEVLEAKDGQRILNGHVLIAPGARHMSVRRSGAYYLVEVRDGPLVNRHKPSVDVLFKSVAKCAGANAVGVIMTGMGDDGARGLKEMRNAGAFTIAQDEASSVVFGMPKEAIKLDAAQLILPLDQIADAMLAGRSALVAKK